MLIILLLTTLVVIVILVYETINYKKKILNEKKQNPGWMDLINEFRRVSPNFKNMEQLEHYLVGINDQVKKFETNYSFLVAFNAIIKEVRERLKQYE